MAVNNQLAPKKNSAPKTFSAYLTNDAVKAKINNIVGGKDGQRFISSIISATSVNPALQECDHGSILSAALLGESLKLSPSPQLGMYYMVPYDQKAKYDRNGNLIAPAKKVATFQLGYKGYIQLASRSGEYERLNVLAIKEGELIKYDPLEEEIQINLIEDDAIREETPTIGYYAFFKYHNGFRKSMYWSKEKMLKHADKYSQAFSLEAVAKGNFTKVSYADYEAGNYPEKDAWKYSSFWYKDFDGMACKTMLRQLISKWGIMSIEMQKAYESDMAAINEDGTYNYVDNQSENDAEIPDNVIDVDGVVVEQEQQQSQEPFTEAEKAEIEAQEAAEAAAEAKADFFDN